MTTKTVPRRPSKTFVARSGDDIPHKSVSGLCWKGCVRCPFKHVIVLWDTTPEAIKEWDAKRSREYENVANTTLMDPLPASMLAMLSQAMEKAIERTETIESEAPSCCYHLKIKVEKKKRGKGPYPEIAQAMEELTREWAEKERKEGIMKKLKQRIMLELCKVLCFIKIHGIVGLERWAAQKISPERYWRRRLTRRRVLRLYRESVRRAQKRKEESVQKSVSVLFSIQKED